MTKVRPTKMSRPTGPSRCSTPPGTVRPPWPGSCVLAGCDEAPPAAGHRRLLQGARGAGRQAEGVAGRQIHRPKGRPLSSLGRLKTGGTTPSLPHQHAKLRSLRLRRTKQPRIDPWRIIRSAGVRYSTYPPTAARVILWIVRTRQIVQRQPSRQHIVVEYRTYPQHLVLAPARLCVQCGEGKLGVNGENETVGRGQEETGATD